MVLNVVAPLLQCQSRQSMQEASIAWCNIYVCNISS